LLLEDLAQQFGSYPELGYKHVSIRRAADDYFNDGLGRLHGPDFLLARAPGVFQKSYECMGISVEPSTTPVLVEDVDSWTEARVIPLSRLAWVAEDLRQLPCPCTIVIRGPLASWGYTEMTMASMAMLLQCLPTTVY
jgi:hypothetical protein